MWHRDLAQHTMTVDVSAEVEHRIHPGQELAVGGLATEAGREGECLDAGGDVAGRVGVDGAAAALVAGVQSGKQLHDLATADLSDDQPVGTHPQGLPDQRPQGHLARPLDVGRP